MWAKNGYLSIKSLGSWVKDLVLRIHFFSYEFNDSDRECALLNLQMFCKDIGMNRAVSELSNLIPWEALVYLTGEITYGGRVTDFWDQRCLRTILKVFFSPKTLASSYTYSSNAIYYAPEYKTLEEYKDYIDNLPIIDDPVIFGMHQNANITFQIAAFKLGRISTEDEHRPGRPVESVTQENIDKIHVLVMLDRRMTVHRIEETLGILKTTMDRIMREHLGLGKLSARWVPKLLTPDQKAVRRKLFSDNLALFEANPEAFVSETNRLVNTILEIQPKMTAAAGAKTDDETVYEKSEEIQEKILLKLDADTLHPELLLRDKLDNVNSLTTVLLQEVDRFNRLINVIHVSLKNLKKAIKGIVVMSEDLEGVYLAFLKNQVPRMWAKNGYLSIKSLGSWVKDLVLRIHFFSGWLIKGFPKSYWLPGFFFQQGFLTGALQNYARKYAFPIDQLSFKFSLTQLMTSQEEITEAEVTRSPNPLDQIEQPEDGVNIHGLFLDAASFDVTSGILQDPLPGVMNSPLPMLLMEPEVAYRPPPELYVCPLYKTSDRAGTLSTTGHSTNFVIAVFLPTRRHPDYWINMGTALLYEEAARKYPEKLAKIIKDGGYCAHQIFNADETGLFWKKMPTRTYIAKSEKNASGFKAAKDRVTLLLCSNASGDRMLKPLLVNRSLKPRALKGKDLNTLPVHWMANKKAWVTTAIFTEWFNKCFVPEVENYMKEMGLEFKILLILDNAPGHPNLEHPNIKVVFFPPNTTCLIQPLDQGIISTFKKYYVKFTFQFIFDKLESDTITVTEVWKQFNILNCVDHVALAIAEIKSQTLNACWKAAWPECVSKRNESNRTTIVTSDIISIAKEIGGEGFDDFGEHDIEELLVDEALNDDDILESMVVTTKDFETVDSELEDVTPLDEKLLWEGLQLSGKLEFFFIQNDNDVERALKFQRDLKFCMSGYRELYKELVKPSQRLITDYLVKEKKITEVPKEALPCRSDDVILSSSDESDLAPIHKRVRTLSDSE
ncbi:DNAH6 [Cordylochernes scorpioides]|uniref:DNAH6 n=1 Tax=Cordylochernes scorpioides TaxID=51811 RepID=A0ABY6LP92_9ARAC|nr:DNAH6 [Cordylochernes scorpioides]